MTEITAGSTYYIEVPGEKNEHIWVVVTDPHPDTRKIVLVNFTSVKVEKRIFDETTIVEAEEYCSVLSKQSYMRYADAKITDVYEMSKIVSSEFVEQRDKCPANLLLRIQEGILSSSQTPNKVKQFINLL